MPEVGSATKVDSADCPSTVGHSTSFVAGCDWDCAALSLLSAVSDLFANADRDVDFFDKPAASSATGAC